MGKTRFKNNKRGGMRLISRMTRKHRKTMMTRQHYNKIMKKSLKNATKKYIKLLGTNSSALDDGDREIIRMHAQLNAENEWYKYTAKLMKLSYESPCDRNIVKQIVDKKWPNLNDSFGQPIINLNPAEKQRYNQDIDECYITEEERERERERKREEREENYYIPLSDKERDNFRADQDWYIGKDFWE